MQQYIITLVIIPLFILSLFGCSRRINSYQLYPSDYPTDIFYPHEVKWVADSNINSLNYRDLSLSIRLDSDTLSVFTNTYKSTTYPRRFVIYSSKYKKKGDTIFTNEINGLDQPLLITSDCIDANKHKNYVKFSVTYNGYPIKSGTEFVIKGLKYKYTANNTDISQFWMQNGIQTIFLGNFNLLLPFIDLHFKNHTISAGLPNLEKFEIFKESNSNNKIVLHPLNDDDKIEEAYLNIEGIKLPINKYVLYNEECYVSESKIYNIKFDIAQILASLKYIVEQREIKIYDWNGNYLMSLQRVKPFSAPDRSKQYF